MLIAEGFVTPGPELDELEPFTNPSVVSGPNDNEEGFSGPACTGTAFVIFSCGTAGAATYCSGRVGISTEFIIDF